MLASPEPGAVVETKFGGIAGGVLVVAAILEETPHRPNVTVEFRRRILFRGGRAARA